MRGIMKLRIGNFDCIREAIDICRTEAIISE